MLLALESPSEHPLAEAVVAHLQTAGVRPTRLTDFKSLTGRGVQATTEGGITYYVGNQHLLTEYVNTEKGVLSLS